MPPINRPGSRNRGADIIDFSARAALRDSMQGDDVLKGILGRIEGIMGKEASELCRNCLHGFENDSAETLQARRYIAGALLGVASIGVSPEAFRMLVESVTLTKDDPDTAMNIIDAVSGVNVSFHDRRLVEAVITVLRLASEGGDLTTVAGVSYDIYDAVYNGYMPRMEFERLLNGKMEGLTPAT